LDEKKEIHKRIFLTFISAETRSDSFTQSRDVIKNTQKPRFVKIIRKSGIGNTLLEFQLPYCLNYDRNIKISYYLKLKKGFNPAHMYQRIFQFYQLVIINNS